MSPSHPASQSHASPPRGAVAATTVEDVAKFLANRIGGQRGACAASFARLLYSRAPQAYFARVPPAEAAAQAERLFALLDKPVDGFQVRIEPHGPAKAAGAGRRVALESVARDQPFILDSLLELLRVRGHEPREVLHPIVAVERDARGAVSSVGAPREKAELASVIHIELDPETPRPDLDALLAEAAEVLREARLVVQDYEPMVARLKEVEARLRERSARASAGRERDDLLEGADFLDWLRRANFIFLGYRGYAVAGTGETAVVEVEHGSGLGILRDEERSSFFRPKSLSGLPPLARERILHGPPVIVHRANADSRVLRRTRMDFVGVKRLDAGGKVIGEDRFQGLFTARAYNDLPSDIPILRRKLEDILAQANLVPGSHDHKEVFSIFTSIPKAELFVTDTAKLSETIFTILAGAARGKIRVSYRPDFLERGVSAMVLLPREKFSSEARVAIQKLLATELGGTPVDYRLALSDGPMARLHFYFEAGPEPRPRPAIDHLEREIWELVRGWDDRLREALEVELGPAEAAQVFRRYAKAFPSAYTSTRSPETAVHDIRHADAALGTGAIEVAIAQTKTSTGGKVSVLKLYRRGEAFPLSTLMPILTHLGLHVLDEQTFRIAPRSTERSSRCEEVFLHSFRVLGPDRKPLTSAAVTRNLEEAIPRILVGDADSDALNALLTSADLDRRQVEVLRAYAAYLLQLGGAWSQRTCYATLLDNTAAARTLIDLFEARFDPRLGPAARAKAQSEAQASLRGILSGVKGITVDQILRSLENLILASVRTSYYRRDESGLPLPVLSIKVRCADVHAMPDPRPLYEIFVRSVGVEGVHLRSGKVARGGIRWSSRPDDYRTEILGLMKAQRTKNAVIVPVGAKGGFLLRRAPASPPPEEIRRQYEAFIGALLDVTDNIADGKTAHPPGVVIHDEEDPYFVVAADRGTAAFSDVANAIATRRGFWLGDAFASGGSRGYSHKQEGITARGVWECARRHFRELGIDPDREPFTVAGIGDMSGDVFGNGLLSSPHAKLLAAFNHAHIFIDPDPDPAASFAERRRLFQLPASAWTDYDAALLSKGGGVYRRDASAIELPAEAQKALGVSAATMNGDELVRAILKMPVDLLYNGGIGTYIKASTETHQEVGDPANNPVRVDGSELRARIVAEGGNLGCTQLGRIEYARAGGRINTDFIDNSAGVDLSDHEVNLKILLEGARRRGALEAEERDSVLREATAEVCAMVLRDNHLQGCVLTLEARRAVDLLDEHALLIEELAAEGLLNRAVERIPADREIARLRESHLGLTRPQLAVLLAYAKIDAYTRVLASGAGAAPDLASFAVGYFPRSVARRFAEDIAGHPLRAEIAATAAVNEAINRMGAGFFHATGRRSGAPFDAILRAYLDADRLCGGQGFYQAMDELYASGARDMEPFHAGLSRFQQAVEAAVRGLLRRRSAGGQAGAAAGFDRKLSELRAVRCAAPPRGQTLLPESIEAAIRLAEGVAEEMDICDLRDASAQPLEAVLGAWEAAGEALLARQVEQEAARIVRRTGEDLQACESLLEAVREQRRRLARAILTAGRRPPGDHRQRLRAQRLLGAARSREPLSPSALYVVVEALGRINV